MGAALKCLKKRGGGGDKKVGKGNKEFMKGWEKSSNGVVPANAFVGGRDGNDENIYVVRAEYDGQTVVGTLRTNEKQANIAVGDEILKKKDYDVLCVEGRWMVIELAEDSIPSDAIKGGRDEKNKPTYIGRIKKKYDHYIGNIDPTTKTITIPMGSKAKEYRNGEILVKAAKGK